MFAGFMTNTWIVGAIVAVVGGAVGFFVIARGSSFVAHALPNGSFAGGAGAALIGINTLVGLGAFSLLGALGIGWLGRRGRHDAVTALVLVTMLAIGSLFLALSSQYSSELQGLLFGEILGVSSTELWPTAGLGAVCLLALLVLYRPLLLSTVLPEVAAARGISASWIEVAFLMVVALATAMTVPVVGTLLVFSLMIGAPAAARALTDRPGRALVLSMLIALIAVGAAIAGAWETDYPVGFFVGTITAACYVLGRLWAALRRRRRGARPGSQVRRDARLDGPAVAGPSLES